MTTIWVFLVKYMKKLIKKLIPITLLKKYRSYKYSKKNKSDFNGKSAKDTFTQIYNTNYWNGETSISGIGSDETQVKTIIESINYIIKEFKINTILDLPCGDFNWMKQVNLNNVNYIGADIVTELIKENSQKYSSNNIQFEVINLISDPIPKCDLIITRDCLVHLSFMNIYDALLNVKLSGSKYILTTIFPDHNLNNDICTGDWRTLNLQSKPFNLKAPIRIFNENCTEANGIYKDKSLALYLIDEIKIPPTQYIIVLVRRLYSSIKFLE